MSPDFKRPLLAALLSLAVIPASAQKMITFDSKEVKTGKSRSSLHGAGYGKNSVTVGMLSWFNGYTPVYYERAVLSMLSVQVGAGVTTRSIGSDLGFMMDNTGESSENFSKAGTYDITDDYSHYKFRSAKPGVYLSFSPKLYYNDEGMDGAYVAPMIEYKMFRYAARKADVSAPVDYNGDDDRRVPHSQDIMEESMRCIDFTVNFGGHYQSRNHVTYGWSTGFGVRNAVGERLDIGVLYDGSGGSVSNGQYANAVTEYKKTKFLFTFNFVVGGWF